MPEFGNTPEDLKAALAQVDWKNAVDVKCAKCDHSTFVMAHEIKKLSPLVSPTGEQLILPMGVFACQKCGHINDELRMPTPQQ